LESNLSLLEEQLKSTSLSAVQRLKQLKTLEKEVQRLGAENAALQRAESERKAQAEIERRRLELRHQTAQHSYVYLAQVNAKQPEFELTSASTSTSVAALAAADLLARLRADNEALQSRAQISEREWHEQDGRLREQLQQLERELAASGEDRDRLKTEVDKLEKECSALHSAIHKSEAEVVQANQKAEESEKSLRNANETLVAQQRESERVLTERLDIARAESAAFKTLSDRRATELHHLRHSYSDLSFQQFQSPTDQSFPSPSESHLSLELAEVAEAHRRSVASLSSAQQRQASEVERLT
jgi:chromosome segregation ATPase